MGRDVEEHVPVADRGGPHVDVQFKMDLAETGLAGETDQIAL